MRNQEEVDHLFAILISDSPVPGWDKLPQGTHDVNIDGFNLVALVTPNGRPPKWRYVAQCCCVGREKLTVK